MLLWISGFVKTKNTHPGVFFGGERGIVALPSFGYRLKTTSSVGVQPSSAFRLVEPDQYFNSASLPSHS
jgi:hypothetical protein